MGWLWRKVARPGEVGIAAQGCKFPGGVYIRYNVEGGSVKSRRHDDLYGVRREQEKFGLKGSKVPVTKVQVVSF